jgi:signal transduction histidine kinase
MSSIFEKRVGASFGVKEGNEILLNIINKSLEKISDSQKDLILEKYKTINFETKIDKTLLWQVGLFLLGIFGVMFIAHLKLRKLNRELEHKIEMAVEEMRQKDRLMFQQSKMAAMGEMVGNIAHQWRQPLNTLSALFYNVIIKYRLGTLDSNTVEDFDNKITKVIKKMNKTIDDFRNFFQPEKEKVKFSILESLNDVVNIVSASYRTYNIDIKISCDHNILMNGYKTELEQVFLVIFNNAKDAIVESDIKNGFIDITVIQEEKNILVNIQDNGGGISEDVIDRVFEPYFTTKHQYIGTGIGLYMSKMIIEESMEGEIHIKNNESGVLITINIPS